MIVNKWTQEIKSNHDPNDAKEDKKGEKKPRGDDTDVRNPKVMDSPAMSVFTLRIYSLTLKGLKGLGCHIGLKSETPTKH